MKIKEFYCDLLQSCDKAYVNIKSDGGADIHLEMTWEQFKVWTKTFATLNRKIVKEEKDLAIKELLQEMEPFDKNEWKSEL